MARKTACPYCGMLSTPQKHQKRCPKRPETIAAIKAAWEKRKERTRRFWSRSEWDREQPVTLNASTISKAWGGWDAFRLDVAPDSLTSTRGYMIKVSTLNDPVPRLEPWPKYEPGLRCKDLGVHPIRNRAGLVIGYEQRWMVL